MLEGQQMKKSFKGFTLVEIMIVVAIIGIIIAIAVPAFLRARENIRGRACQDNLAKGDDAKVRYAIECRIGNTVTVGMDNLMVPPNAGTGEGYIKRMPLCPAGGTYAVAAIGTDPSCNYAAPTWAVQHVIPD